MSVYREIVRSIDNPSKVCGFVCGQQELTNWPKYDIFQLYYDTRPIYGKLEDFLKSLPTRDDAREVAVTGASNIYHAVCHNYLFDGDKCENLETLYKCVFFVTRAKYFHNNGIYIPSKKELLRKCVGADIEIMKICEEKGSLIQNDEASIKFYSAKLMEYCGELLKIHAREAF